MKKGICIGSLPGNSTEARFELAKEAGFDGVEIGTLVNDTDRRETKSDRSATSSGRVQCDE